jgi:hypothetical protein
MITIKLMDQNNTIIKGRLDHEKPITEFCQAGEESSVLAIKEYQYQVGDKISITTSEKGQYLWVQLDETLAPSIIYLASDCWEYLIPQTTAKRKAMVDTGFASKRHHIMVRKAHHFEIRNYQNLSFNAHDQPQETGVYPHAIANVETRNEAVFFACNGIDGKLGNQSHGSYPFASWGINQQEDAELTIKFGRLVEVDWIRLLFRGDYPHDSFWTEVTFELGSVQKTVQTINSLDFQEFTFEPVETDFVTIKNLKKMSDEALFPALTQIEVFGKNKF